MTNTPNAAAALTADQDAALRAMADRIVDFLEAGIERFGSPEAFVAAFRAFEATR